MKAGKSSSAKRGPVKAAPPSIADGPSAVLALEPIIQGVCFLLASMGSDLSDFAESSDISETGKHGAYGAHELAMTQAYALLSTYHAAHAEWKALREQAKGGAAVKLN